MKQTLSRSYQNTTKEGTGAVGVTRGHSADGAGWAMKIKQRCPTRELMTVRNMPINYKCYIFLGSACQHCVTFKINILIF